MKKTIVVLSCLLLLAFASPLFALSGMPDLRAEAGLSSLVVDAQNQAWSGCAWWWYLWRFWFPTPSPTPDPGSGKGGADTVNPNPQK